MPPPAAPQLPETRANDDARTGNGSMSIGDPSVDTERDDSSNNTNNVPKDTDTRAMNSPRHDDHNQYHDDDTALPSTTARDMGKEKVPGQKHAVNTGTEVGHGTTKYPLHREVNLPRPHQIARQSLQPDSPPVDNTNGDESDEKMDTVVVISDDDESSNGDGDPIVDLDMSDSRTLFFTAPMCKCEQLCPTTWREFRSLFLLPQGTKHGMDPAVKIPIPYMKRHPYLYQLFGAVWMLQRERRVEKGGFLCDEMGLGKTMTAITYFVLNVLLAENREHIRRHPEQHLPKGSGSAECPVQKQFCFRCACVSSVYSAHNLPPTHGPTLIVVPKSLLIMWIKQWSQTIEETCLIRLVTAHGTTSAAQIRQFNHPGIVAPSSPQASVLRPQGPNHNNVSRRSEVSKLAVITTSGCYHHADALVTQCDHKGHVTNRTTWRALFRDECHMEKNRDSGTVQIFRGLVKNSAARPAVWLLSGTPSDRGPIDIQAWLNTLRSEEWANDEVLKMAGGSAYKEMANRVNNRLSRDRDRELYTIERRQLEADASTYSKILERIMIQRVTETTWFGHKLVDLPPHEHLNVKCTLGSGFAARLQEEEEQVMGEVRTAYQHQLENWHRRGCPDTAPRFQPHSFFQRSRKTRMVAIFPGLLDVSNSCNLELTLKELDGFRARNVQSPYLQHLHTLVESSEKCKWLGCLLREMRANRDYCGRHEKLVIVTAFPVVVHIMEEV